MSKPSKGSWLVARGLDPGLVERLQDFCEGHHGSPDHRILAAALEHYMAHTYEKEPEVKRRADEARKKRLGEKA